MKKVLCILIVCITIILCLSSCGGTEHINANQYSIENFTRLLEAGEYKKAAEMYSTVLGNTQCEDEVKQKLNEFVNAAINSYLANETDYETAKSRVETVKQVVDYSGMQFLGIQELDEKLSDANNSKIAYDSGKDLLDMKNYLDAIEAFKKVVETDSNYDDAQKKLSEAIEAYKNEMLQKAERYFLEKDYDNAAVTVGEALQILPGDTDLLAKQTTYFKSYIAAVLNEAESAFINPGKDYEKAINLLKPAMQKYPDNDSLQEKYDYYLSFQPVSLFDMKPYQEDGSIHSGQQLLDTRGNTYENGWYTLSSYLSCGGEMVYDVNKWDLFTGTISVYRGSESKKENGSLKIYGDNKLLYEKTITRSSAPEKISVNITGITNLKIKIDTASWYGADVLLADAALQKTTK